MHFLKIYSYIPRLLRWKTHCREVTEFSYQNFLELVDLIKKTFKNHILFCSPWTISSSSLQSSWSTVNWFPKTEPPWRLAGFTTHTLWETSRVVSSTRGSPSLRITSAISMTCVRLKREKIVDLKLWDVYGNAE